MPFSVKGEKNSTERDVKWEIRAGKVRPVHFSIAKLPKLVYD